MTVAKIIWAQFVWKRHPAVHLPPQIHPLFIDPEPGYPHGNKGGRGSSGNDTHRAQAKRRGIPESFAIAECHDAPP